MDDAQSRDVVQDFYDHYYERVFNSGGLVGWSYKSTHRQMEQGVTLPSGASILELGAGTGEHLPYVNPDFGKYVMVDLSDPPAHPHWQGDPRIEWVTADISSDLTFDAQFDRVISMCVFHHLADPEAAMVNIKRWLKPGGVFTLFLPSDPGVLNRVNRRLFVMPKARKMGFEKYPLMAAQEHRNHYWSLNTLLLEHFDGYHIKRRYKPFGIPSGNLSSHSIWHITKPA